MQNHQNRMVVIVAAAIGGLSLLAASPSSAAPFTSNLDPLIVAMQTQAAALSGNTTKAAVAEEKAITKSLALLDKPAVSELVDLKNTVTIVKSLLKFPDFSTAYGPAVDDAVLGFKSDAQTLIDEAQTAINALPDSSCKTKAQATLDLATAALAAIDLNNPATISTLLNTAFKDAVKAQAATLSKACSGQAGGGGGGKSDSLTMTVNGTSWTAGDMSAGGEYEQGAMELSFGGQTAGNSSVLALVVTGITGPGTNNVVSGNYTEYSPANALYFVESGQIIVTTFDLAGKKIAGTFSFMATANGSTNIINATQGSFNITDLNVTQ